MDIQSVSVLHLSKSGFTTDCHDGVRHQKALPWLSVVQSVSGSYDIQIGNGKTFCTGDGGFFVAPYLQHQTITHHSDPHTGMMKCRWVFLDVQINGRYRLEDLYDLPVIIPNEYKARLNDIFDKLFLSVDPFEELIYGIEITRILCKIGTQTLSYKNSLASALAMIEEKYSERITVEMLAKSVNLSESRFYTLFKQQLGVPPIQYLNTYRMSVAAQALITTEKTVKEIAFSVGVEDGIYFNKLFKRVYHMSPTQYRKNNWASR